MPSTAAATLTVTRREETFRTMSRRAARQPCRVRGAESDRRRLGDYLRCARRGRVERPAPWAPAGLPPAGTAVPTSAPFRAAASSSGSSLRE